MDSLTLLVLTRKARERADPFSYVLKENQNSLLGSAGPGQGRMFDGDNTLERMEMRKNLVQISENWKYWSAWGGVAGCEGGRRQQWQGLQGDPQRDLHIKYHWELTLKKWKATRALKEVT